MAIVFKSYDKSETFIGEETVKFRVYNVQSQGEKLSAPTDVWITDNVVTFPLVENATSYDVYANDVKVGSYVPNNQNRIWRLNETVSVTDVVHIIGVGSAGTMVHNTSDTEYKNFSALLNDSSSFSGKLGIMLPSTYATTSVALTDNSGKFINDYYREMCFYSSINDSDTYANLSWLNNNAKKIGRIELSFLPEFSKLSDGNYDIKIVAKAPNYISSDKSSSVTVNKVATDNNFFYIEGIENTELSIPDTYGVALQYNIDNTIYDYSNDTINLKAGVKCYWLSAGSYNLFWLNKNHISSFVSTGFISAGGNLLSLIDYTMTGIYLSTRAKQNVGGIFKNCTKLKDITGLLLLSDSIMPFTYGTYRETFYGCSELITVPVLSKVLVESCYYYMFYNCTAINKVPELADINEDSPSTCYYAMFNGCTSLKVGTTGTSKIFSFISASTAENWNAVKDMFTNTGGTFTGTPEVGNTYYNEV